MDTTRADHMSTYGYERPTSPNLTALAAAAKPLCDNVQVIGDAMSPRTAEEAVYEGLVAAMNLG